MQVKSIAECSKAILLTFIKITFVIKIFVLSIFEWLLYTGFTVDPALMKILHCLVRYYQSLGIEIQKIERSYE